MESLFVLEKSAKKCRKFCNAMRFCTRKFLKIFSENFVIKLPGWNYQKILKVGVSLGGT